MSGIGVLDEMIPGRGRGVFYRRVWSDLGEIVDDLLSLVILDELMYQMARTIEAGDDAGTIDPGSELDLLLGRVTQLEGLTGQERVLEHRAQLHARARSWVRTSGRDLAKRLPGRRTKATVLRRLNQLSEDGWILVSPEGGETEGQRYSLRSPVG